MNREPTLAETDPRAVGGRYRSGYWAMEYTVTRTELRHGVLWLTCQWADFSVTTHCTPWEPWRDTIVSQPAS